MDLNKAKNDFRETARHSCAVQIFKKGDSMQGSHGRQLRKCDVYQ